MKRGEQGQAFICILLSLLVYTPIWYGVSLEIGVDHQGKLLSFDSSKGLPLGDGEDYPTRLSLWQVDQSSIILPQTATRTSSYKVSSKGIKIVRRALYCSQQDTDSKYLEAFSALVDTPIPSSDLKNYLICQNLDIPPPSASVSLG